MSRTQGVAAAPDTTGAVVTGVEATGAEGATGAGEGFGVLALASAYPVLNILLLGLFLSARKAKEARVEA